MGDVEKIRVQCWLREEERIPFLASGIRFALSMGGLLVVVVGVH
jgi:hypothetical protein